MGRSLSPPATRVIFAFLPYLVAISPAVYGRVRISLFSGVDVGANLDADRAATRDDNVFC